MEGLRRLLVVAVTGAMLSTILAGSALADQPITFTDSETFTDVNPCTGLSHEITIDVAVSIHQHKNNEVVHVDRSGSTESGFTMIKGTESFVANINVVRGSFTDQWRHPDGSKFVAQGQFVFNINKLELLIDNFTLRCLGNN
jgi:hypothetical protein